MTLKELKLEFFFFRRSMAQRKSGMTYLYNRFIRSREIRAFKPSFERPVTHEDLSMHMLIGHKHVDMTLWSLGSYYASSKLIGHLFIHSDSTLTDKDKNILKKFFPAVTIVEPEDGLDPPESPWSNSDIIMNFRKQFADNFFLRKLVDPLTISTKKYRLIIDCDMLWFGDPVELRTELERGCERSLMMSNEGVSEKELSNTVFMKDGSHLSRELSMFNGGIMLFKAENLPVDALETYFTHIDMTHPLSKHFVEQSGYSSLLRNLDKLPKDVYTIRDDVSEKVIVKHYTGPRRELFYISGLDLVEPLLFNLNSHE